MSAVDLVDDLTEVVRTLDEATARFSGDRDPAAGREALDAAEQVIVLAHRVRDQLAREVRA